MNELPNAADEKHVIDFFSAGPDKNVMPYMEFQHCMNQAIEQYKEALLHTRPAGPLLIKGTGREVFAKFTSVY